MSRLAKKPINLPDKTTASVDGDVFTVTGPLGALSRAMGNDVTVQIEGNIVTVAAKNPETVGALLGTAASHIRNMVLGVTKGYQKKLQIEGIGYKAEVKGENLVLSIGFSHLVPVAIPKGLKVVVEKNIVTITGIDKEVIGHFSAKIRSLKKPEPYKGKGIMYVGEVIRRKQGKKAA